jgi:hypothetical protein
MALDEHTKICYSKLDVGCLAVIPATWKVDIRRIAIGGQSGHLNKQVGMVVHIYNPSYLRGKGRQIMV